MSRVAAISVLVCVVFGALYVIRSVTFPEAKDASPPNNASGARSTNGTADDLVLLKRQLEGAKRIVQRLHVHMRDEPQPPFVDYSVLAQRHHRRSEDFSNDHDDETIFVSIASFRDLECPPTVEDMFAKARNPRRLFLGIIEQNDPSDPSCIPASYLSCRDGEFCPYDNIRIRRVRPSEARGPTFGRHVAMLMYQGEKYYMMIDSHNRFVVSWDSRLLNIYKVLPSKKSVISNYPNAWLNDSQTLEGHGYVTVMCAAHFIDYGYLRLDGMAMAIGKNRLQPFAAGGFVFADALLVKEVPFDPYLDYIFDGEEITYSARMWTHGWDIYSPSENLLFHYYYRWGANRVWSVPNNNWYPKQLQSAKRIQYMLGSTKANTTERLVPLDTADRLVTRELDKYGMGKERSIEEYWRFAKVDPVHRIAGAAFCQGIN